MMKRSLNKGTFINASNYKSRWFVLDREFLRYFDGTFDVSTLFWLLYITWSSDIYAFYCFKRENNACQKFIDESLFL